MWLRLVNRTKNIKFKTHTLKISTSSQGACSPRVIKWSILDNFQKESDFILGEELLNAKICALTSLSLLPEKPLAVTIYQKWNRHWKDWKMKWTAIISPFPEEGPPVCGQTLGFTWKLQVSWGCPLRWQKRDKYSSIPHSHTTCRLCVVCQRLRIEWS